MYAFFFKCLYPSIIVCCLYWCGHKFLFLSLHHRDSNKKGARRRCVRQSQTCILPEGREGGCSESIREAQATLRLPEEVLTKRNQNTRLPTTSTFGKFPIPSEKNYRKNAHIFGLFFSFVFSFHGF